MLCHADTDGRRDHPVHFLGQFLGYDLRAKSIGADETGRAVLLGGTDRHDHGRRTLQVGFDLGPGHQLQAHAGISLSRNGGLRAP